MVLPAADAVLLRTRGLALRAAGRQLVRGLDWDVRLGERWCVLGRNAVGKSTLLRALAGLPVPERVGDVRWFERLQDEWMPADAARVRAFVPQQPGDRFPLSVAHLLSLAGSATTAAQVAGVLAALDAGDLAERGIHELSGGERQRVALAQGALQGAPLLLLDEPVSFQDPAHQQQVARWLVDLTGVALVLSAHDVNWVARVATHVLLLQGGGAWEAGPTAQMLTASRLERAYGCPWRDSGGVWVAA